MNLPIDSASPALAPICAPRLSDPTIIPAPEVFCASKDFMAGSGHTFSVSVRYSRAGDLPFAIKAIREDLLQRWAAGGPCITGTLTLSQLSPQPVPQLASHQAAVDQSVSVKLGPPPVRISPELATRIGILVVLAASQSAGSNQRQSEVSNWTEHHWVQLAVRDYEAFLAVSDWATNLYIEVCPDHQLCPDLKPFGRA